MTEPTYTQSFRRRLRVLFSPLRLTLFIAAIIVLVVANVVYISGGGTPEWLGPASVVPIFAFVIWMVSTDRAARREDRQRH